MDISYPKDDICDKGMQHFHIHLLILFSTVVASPQQIKFPCRNAHSQQKSIVCYLQFTCWNILFSRLNISFQEITTLGENLLLGSYHHWLGWRCLRHCHRCQEHCWGILCGSLLHDDWQWDNLCWQSLGCRTVTWNLKTYRSCSVCHYKVEATQCKLLSRKYRYQTMWLYKSPSLRGQTVQDNNYFETILIHPYNKYIICNISYVIFCDLVFFNFFYPSPNG